MKLQNGRYKRLQKTFDLQAIRKFRPSLLRVVACAGQRTIVGDVVMPERVGVTRRDQINTDDNTYAYIEVTRTC